MRNEFKFDRDDFAASFDRRAFYLEHSLVDHPLFELSALAALSQRLSAPQVEWNAGHAGAYGKPDEIRPATLPCAETILGVAERPTWVLLLHIQTDPLYKQLLDELLDQIEPLVTPLIGRMSGRQGFIFVSSRESVTPYHFDPEYNFLLQVRGAKTVHMWSPTDHAVIAESAIGDFYAGFGSNRDQPYDAAFEHSAWVLPLPAGRGLHFPLHAPHWVKTESEVSISLSITFQSRQSDFQQSVHATNAHVRRLGIEPPRPGVSALWDGCASFGYRAARKTRHLFKRGQAQVAQSFSRVRNSDTR